ncbi:50S ribosomal protein L30 [Streptomyces avermitilis]|uniref:50S ribosomal protein L30 n=1 Tax=Streptomyces avermitilis TaxID=33903 RepID=UPI0033A07B7A
MSRKQLRGSGDLLVTQTRSPIGRPKEIRKVLTSLGLHGIGQARIFDRDQPSIRGQLHRANPCIRTEELALPSTVAASNVIDSASAAEMDTYSYHTDELPALRLSRGMRNYAQLETYPDFVALAWTTGIRCSTYLDRICDLIDEDVPTEADTAVLAIADCAGHTVTDGGSAVRDAAEHPLEVKFLRVDYSNFSIIWRTPSYGPGAEWEPGEAGLIIEKFDPQLCASYLRRTATPDIAVRARGISGTFAVIY